ncbi:unnamed protein product [Bemisia tabaci]|uniref:Patronin n=1 Tax=Bemisia tabaci TaxID=7038 RepID=A0A9P0C6M7_BEMTA|nr:unnamed protein product [Bemisia tabaci]
MDRGDTMKSVVTDAEPTYDTRQAKQRATVKWLLSKAFNNKVPENLREPFYRNHENQEHLKPQVVHALANAELYCLALGNIYSDPNYHNLNHWGVLQALNRKNISITDPHLTETVLIQTNPLKMSAHMTVMEAVMTLYTKEVATPDRVLAAVRRFSHNSTISEEPPDHESALVMWINEAVKALRQRICQEVGQGDQNRIPDIPVITDVLELCDGIGLAALVSFYCPDDLPWRKILVNKVPTISDCVRNLLLVHDFCQQSLPYSIFHMMPEDVSYLRGSMRSNLIVFLADLFNVLEIHPAKCVRFDHAASSLTEAYPRNSHGVAHKRCLPLTVSAIPDLRSNLDTHSTGFTGSVSSPVFTKKSNTNQENSNDDRRNTEEFVVHRGRSVPTLSSVVHNNVAERSPISNDIAAGRPSNWEESRRPSYAGRRSRRNSLSEDSQLTIENFGGSQENLHLLGKNPDKEPAVHIGRKDPSPSPKISAQENRNSNALHSVLQSDTHIDSTEPPQRISLSRQSSLRSKSSNHAETMSSAGLQNSLFDPEEEVIINKRNSEVPTEKKVTSFAALPSNTTTWQQQRDINSHSQPDREETETETEVMGSQLLNIRLKLEEKRRLIESEKRRMEAVFNKQRQQFGKAAFFQAVTKGKSGEKTSCNTPDSDPGQQVSNSKTASPKSDKPQRPFSLQDISEVEQKWLDGNNQTLVFLEDKKTPDYDNMDLEQYQKSMSQMNSSLHEIQEDLQRLTLQQKQIRQDENAPPQMQSFASLSQNKPTMQSFVVNNHQTSLSVNQQQSLYNQPGNPMNHLNNCAPNEQQWHSLQQPQLMNSFANHQPMLINQQPINSYISQPSVNNYVNNRQPISNYLQQQSQPVNNYISQQQTLNNSYVNQSPNSYSSSHLPVNSYGKESVSNFSSPQRQMHSLVNNHPQSQINTNTYSVNQQNLQYRSFVSTNNSNQQQVLNQQQQQVNQLIRNSQEPSDQSAPSSQFFLHDQPTQRKTWQQSTPITISTEPRNTWVNKMNKQSQPSSLSSSPSNAGFTLHHNGNSDHSAPTPPPRRNSSSSITHAPVPTPSVDDMEPQSISFIVKSNEKITDEEEFSEGLSRLQITSGNRTYRIPSPTRAHARINQGNMQPQNQPEKGFYISFDDDSPPKRPKPPLRVKRGSPKKDRGLTQVVEPTLNNVNHDPIPFAQDDYSPSPNRAERSPPKRTIFSPTSNEASSVPDCSSSAKPRPTTNVGLIIDNELNNCDPSTIDEMERKKERILLLSLQRRQQQEELKARKELEAHQRREKEKQKEEDRARKKEEDKARRAAILEQYKLKKAFEEAEREGKTIDKDLQNSLKLNNIGNRGPPRLRKQNTRPRPKTIHIDHDHADGMLTPSQGKKGSTSNLSVLSSPMRRDYYRGSQDCLAETRRTSVSGASLYSDFGEDSRGASPGRSLGRRSSYKTSRDPSPEGRHSNSKFNTYHTRRKSNSLMNLSGSSCEQDSLLYRYGDTDSGLGRATPPRRAPSPGHPPSPSGPGSLPARRRYNDDTASESGGSEYSGPRLYKQPATKSNRGIILNAVEYCVFPGVVNRDAKRRVLDEINRSEAKHFLILFRDAGCQFRALYSYCPETEEVAKLYGTGPKLVTDRMFDKFFKYNSGGKCFSQVHTKHLTVTIDAFTIHNSLWQGKKMVNLLSKRDMALVI